MRSHGGGLDHRWVDPSDRDADADAESVQFEGEPVQFEGEPERGVDGG